jgi:23S rRNA pseudouridine2605 synthase
MSRSAAAELIATGRVRVNGRVVTAPGKWIDLHRDRLSLQGRPLGAAPPTYLALHKPRGLVTTRRDERGRETVYACLEGFPAWVFPVGRLDRQSSGLLLFTNDTAWSEGITAPEAKLVKTYEAKLRGHPTEESLEALRRGLTLEDGTRTRPAQVRILRATEKATWVELRITEGKYRQVRRMGTAIGHEVLTLIRTAIGSLGLGDLAPGAFRALAPAEVRALARPGLARPRAAPERGRAGRLNRPGPRRR